MSTTDGSDDCDVIDEMRQGWNTADSARYAAVFSEDAVFVDVLGRVQRGRAMIAGEHRKIFDTIYAGSTLEIRELDRHRLDGHTEILRTATTLSVPAGPRHGDTHAVQTNVLHDGRIVAFQNTVVGEIAAFAGHDAALAGKNPLDWHG